MKNRILLCLLLLCFMLFMPATADTEIYKNVCPINVEMYVENSAEGTMLAFSGFNASAGTVSEIDFSVRLSDEEKNTVTDGEDEKFRACAEGLSWEPYAEKKLYWSLADWKGASFCTDFCMNKVIFEDGTEWKKPDGKLYAAPYFYAENKKTPDGRYILSGDNALHLVDYSYSSHEREWYINTADYGWMPFDTSITADCFVWKPEVELRLTINGDKELSRTETFSVITSPGALNVVAYKTGELCTVRPCEEVIEGERPRDAVHFDVPLPIGEEACLLAFWDLNEAEKRTWSILINGEWIPFAWDRGPMCEFWRQGTNYIKLDYGTSEAVYAIDVAGL